MHVHLKAGIIGGLILFIWGAVSWMALPYHKQTLNNFTNVKAVSDVIQANTPRSGMYVLPNCDGNANTPSTAGPAMLASIRLEGRPSSMIPNLIISLATQIVAAFLVACILTRARGGYFSKLSMVVVFGLAAGVITEIPYWNWFGFTSQFTLVQMADLLIGWFLAGLAMAKICKN